MRLVPWRAGSIGAVFVLCSALATAAQACNGPNVGIGPDTAGPGDQVSFTISNLNPGAHWSLQVDGGEIRSGDVAPNEYMARGTFTVPDSGHNVSVSAVITHDDIATADHSDRTDSKTLFYRAPSSSAPSAQQPPAQESAPSPQSSVQQPTSAPTATHGGAGSTGPAAGGAHPGPRARANPSQPSPSASPSSTVTRTRAAAAGNAAASAVGGFQATQGAGQAARARGQVVIAVPAANPRSADRIAPVPVARLAAPSGPPMPVVLGLAGLALAGLAGAGLAAWRRPAGPPPDIATTAPLVVPPAPRPTEDLHALAVEAELQEMVAEHAAGEGSALARAGPPEDPG